ncbi:MAG: hypothetical protein KGK07_07705 [Chloroflexota bacterium]|nr:hypothetical protein [Chloroflexota bacterium]
MPAITPGRRAAPRFGEPSLVAHMGVLSGAHRPNTIAAIRECFEQGVGRIEIDVHSLDGGDFIVTHARRLEHETTGRGPVGRATPDDVRAARFLHDAGDRPPLLSEVAAMAAGCETELQLDLKDWRPPAPERIEALLRAVGPVHERVIVSSGQDWNLRRLLAAAPSLAVGFDPGLYLDVLPPGEPAFLPRTEGAYGYRDDHPLALGRTLEPAAYLRERMEALATQVPASREWFLRYGLVLRMRDDGFDAVAWLRNRGIDANVWTLDYDGEAAMRAFERLAAAGVARVTTNTTPAWTRALSAPRASP